MRGKIYAELRVIKKVITRSYGNIYTTTHNYVKLRVAFYAIHRLLYRNPLPIGAGVTRDLTLGLLFFNFFYKPIGHNPSWDKNV